MQKFCGAALQQGTRIPSPRDNWDKRSVRWGLLMAKAQAGDGQSYRQLFRELDIWLRRYYARRLPHPAADDARQEALLAVHANRHTYAPPGPFGAWVMGIARYKWADRIRDATRHLALPLDQEIAVEDHGQAVVCTATLDDLLGRLKPAQENVIRLVKLEGFSVSQASSATGQSASLVKINIHRGMKKLATMVS
jgi:RNA polymerase sigma factor (sigma-70 family)